LSRVSLLWRSAVGTIKIEEVREGEREEGKEIEREREKRPEQHIILAPSLRY
jgi:hypothetical protein